jgi:transposase-like protein
MFEACAHKDATLRTLYPHPAVRTLTQLAACAIGDNLLAWGSPLNRTKGYTAAMAYPRAGKDYPRSLGEFQAWFRTDADCLDYLEWLRWPAGFVCPTCGVGDGWRLADGRFKCSCCGARTSVTACTIFDRTRTPLTVWFTACWLFATGKDGISALSLKRTLEIGSYQTVWAMLHRMRSVLVRPGRERLAGIVEVDETYIGGQEPGLSGGRAKGKKILTGIAVEIHEPKGYGRCRIAPLSDASSTSLHAFVLDHIEPGATVITDGWQGYQGLDKLGYCHEARSQRAGRARGEDPAKLLPAVHRVASLAKRWLLGTHQGSVDDAHLPAYLNEFVFRFNRRHSRSRGMVFYRVLELAVAHDPVRYADIVAGRRPRAVPPAPPRACTHPSSLDQPPAGRPWRAWSG